MADENKVDAVNLNYKEYYQTYLEKVENDRKIQEDTELKEIAKLNDFQKAVEIDKQNSYETEERKLDDFQRAVEIDKQTRDANWYDVMSSLPEAVWLDWKMTGLSVGKVITDMITNYPGVSKSIVSEQFYKEGINDPLNAEMIETATEQMKNQPNNMSYSQSLVYNGTVMLGKMLPVVLSAGATGGSSLAPTLTSFSGTAMSLSAMEASQKYAQLKINNIDDKTAITTAMLYGGISYFAEKIPLEKLINPSTKFEVKEFLSTILGEVGAEVLTDIGHHAVDVGVMGEEKTLSDLLKQIGDTAVLTALVTPVIGGVGRYGLRKKQDLYNNFFQKSKAMGIVELERQNKIMQEYGLNELKIDSPVDPETGLVMSQVELSTIVEDAEGNKKLLDTPNKVYDFYGMNKEDIDITMDVIKNDPVMSEKLLNAPLIDVDIKKNNFINNGNIDISIAQDIDQKGLDILIDLDKRILTNDEIALLDIPDYITLDDVEKAKLNLIDKYKKKGNKKILRTEDTPEFNILDNIEKRLLMSPRTVRKIINSKNTLEGNLDNVNKRNIDIKKKTNKMYAKVRQLSNILNKYNVERFDTLADIDKDEFNRFMDIREEADNLIDEINIDREELSKEIRNLKNKKKVSVKGMDKVTVENLFKGKAKVIENIDQKPIEDIEIESIEDKNIDTPLATIDPELLAELKEDLITSFNEKKKIMLMKKSIEKTERTDLLKEKKERIKSLINKVFEPAYTQYLENIDYQRKTGVEFSEKFIEDGKVYSDMLADTMNDISNKIDILDRMVVNFKSDDFIGFENFIKDIDKKFDDIKVNTDNFLRSSYNEMINAGKINTDVINNISDIVEPSDIKEVLEKEKIKPPKGFLQWFALDGMDDKTFNSTIKQFESDFKNTGRDVNLIDNIVTLIKRKREVAIKGKNGNSFFEPVKNKDHKYNFVQRLLNNFVMPHHINDPIYQAYIEGFENQIAKQTSVIKQEAVELGRDFNTLTSNEKARLLEFVMIPSSMENIVFNKNMFKNKFKNTGLNIDQIDKYYDAYLSYGKMMDYVTNYLIDKVSDGDKNISSILKDRKLNYYVPLQREGVYKLIVKDKQNSKKVYYYYTTNSIKDLEARRQGLEDGSISFRMDKDNWDITTKLSDFSDYRNHFDIVMENETDNKILRNIARKFFDIYIPNVEKTDVRTQWDSVFALSENVDKAIDQAVNNMAEDKSNSPESVANKIKKELLDLNRKASKNPVSDLLTSRQGVSGYDVRQVIDNIDSTVLKAVNSASRYDLLKYNNDFLDTNKYMPEDIKDYIKSYYRANIDNRTVMDQLAGKLAYTNTLYHLGFNLSTAIKNIVTAFPLNLMVGGEMGVSPVDLTNNFLKLTPSVYKFTKDFSVELMKNIDFNRSITFDESINKIDEIAKHSGFSENQIIFIKKAFMYNYLDAGISDEFIRTFSNKNNKLSNMLTVGMMPFKMSEIAVRLASTLNTAEMIQKSSGESILDDSVMYKAFTIVNKHQPRGGIGGKIMLAQNRQGLGAIVRASMNLLNFTFNATATMMQQGLKAKDVFKKEKGIDKITKNNYLKGLGAFMLYNLIGGGIATIPFNDELREMWREVLGEEDFVSQWQTGDSELGKFLANGMMGVMGFDIPGLAWGIPIETIGSGGLIGGMARRITEGSSELISGAIRGDWWRAYKGLEYGSPTVLRRLMKSMREAVYGIETKEGIKLIDPDTYEVRKLSTPEAVLKTLTGLDLKTKNYDDYKKNIIKYDMKRIYNESKQSIVKHARRLIQSEDYNKAEDIIEKFNEKLYNYYEKNGYLPTTPIKSVSTQKVDI